MTLDTVVDESRKMADGVTRFPARLCSGGEKLCYYGRLEHDFLAFVPCFLLFLFLLPYPGMFYLRVPSSVQQSSATLSKYVAHVLSSRVICILPHLGIHLFSFVKINI